MLMLKFVVSPSGVNTTIDVFTYIICMALTIFSGMSHARRNWNCVSIYRFKGFLEVYENNGSFFLVVSHFFDDASKSKNLQRCRS